MGRLRALPGGRDPIAGERHRDPLEAERQRRVDQSEFNGAVAGLIADYRILRAQRDAAIAMLDEAIALARRATDLLAQQQEGSDE